MKFLLITEVDSRRNYGGKEKFNRFLIKHIIKMGHEVVEFCLNFQKESNFSDTNYGNNYKFISFPYELSTNLNWKMNKIDNVINKYCEENKFDVIISSLHDNLKKTKKQKNFIYVIHNSPAGLLGWNSDNIFFPLKKIFKYILGYTSQFKNLEHIVVPDKETGLDLIKRSKKYKKINIHIIPWPQNNEKNLVSLNDVKKRKNEVVWVGRIYNKQKNIKYLNKVAEELKKYDIKLNVYGDGPDKKFLTSNNIKFHGWLNSKDKLKEISKYKAFIMVSNNEGASLVLYEAISIGLPIIGRKTFPSISFLVKDGRGVLINKNKRPKNFTKEINKLINLDESKYFEIVKKNINFYNSNLNIEFFEKGWTELIKNLEKN